MEGGACRNPARSCTANHPAVSAAGTVVGGAGRGPALVVGAADSDPFSSGALPGTGAADRSAEYHPHDGSGSYSDFAAAAREVIAAAADRPDSPGTIVGFTVDGTVGWDRTRSRGFLTVEAAEEQVPSIATDSAAARGTVTYANGLVTVACSDHDGVSTWVLEAVDTDGHHDWLLARDLDLLVSGGPTAGTHEGQLAANPRAGPDLLDRLAGSERWGVRHSVAGHGRTRPATLARLAADPDEDVRAAAAANPNTPPAGKAAAGLLTD